MARAASTLSAPGATTWKATQALQWGQWVSMNMSLLELNKQLQTNSVVCSHGSKAFGWVGLGGPECGPESGDDSDTNPEQDSEECVIGVDHRSPVVVAGEDDGGDDTETGAEHPADGSDHGCFGKELAEDVGS